LNLPQIGNDGIWMLLISYSATDVGRKRKNNEDSFLADDTLGLYVVADGVGGQERGEIASKEAVENIHCWILRHANLLHKFSENPDESFLYQIRRMLESGIQSSCGFWFIPAIAAWYAYGYYNDFGGFH
jgi:serine/threonine protein phosphatase PrpC